MFFSVSWGARTSYDSWSAGKRPLEMAINGWIHCSALKIVLALLVNDLFLIVFGSLIKI
jgi:hypothetical protein